MDFALTHIKTDTLRKKYYFPFKAAVGEGFLLVAATGQPHAKFYCDARHPQQDVARDWTRRDGASAHSLRGRPHGQIWLTILLIIVGLGMVVLGNRYKRGLIGTNR
jgi:hypothetical protein